MVRISGDKSRDWTKEQHVDYCTDLLTFCEIFGIGENVRCIEIFGSCAVVGIWTSDGEYLGRIIQFSNSRRKWNGRYLWDHFQFAFDPELLGINREFIEEDPHDFGHFAVYI